MSRSLLGKRKYSASLLPSSQEESQESSCRTLSGSSAKTVATTGTTGSINDLFMNMEMNGPKTRANAAKG